MVDLVLAVPADMSVFSAMRATYTVRCSTRGEYRKSERLI